MELSLDQGRPIRDPNAAQIEEALHSLDSPASSFAILERDSQTYLQAAGSCESGFIIEYQDGDTDRHFKAAREKIPLHEVVKAFQAYAGGGDEWRTMFSWQPLSVDAFGLSRRAGFFVFIVTAVIVILLISVYASLRR